MGEDTMVVARSYLGISARVLKCSPWLISPVNLLSLTKRFLPVEKTPRKVIRCSPLDGGHPKGRGVDGTKGDDGRIDIPASQRVDRIEAFVGRRPLEEASSMMAATRSLLALLLLLSVLSCALCQTFQYSRGWRPGKRSVRSRQPEDLLEVVRANLKDASIADADKQLEQCASIVRNLLEYGAAPKAQELLLSCEALFEGDNSAGGAARFLQ
ncbi:hypothetical protein KM043_003354 [Ampulex compressa]|nr:hypothetical protein KM043_003354 [Ampulex compressa]